MNTEPITPHLPIGRVSHRCTTINVASGKVCFDIVLGCCNAISIHYWMVLTDKDNRWHFQVKFYTCVSTHHQCKPRWVTGARVPAVQTPQSCTFQKCAQGTTREGTVRIPPGLTVRSLWASFELLQTNSLEPPSQNHHKFTKTNTKNDVFTPYLLVLHTGLTRKLKLMRVVLTWNRDTSALYWKDSLYKFHHHYNTQ